MKHLTIEPELLALAVKRIEEKRYGNFSEYIRHLIRVDTLSMRNEENIKDESREDE